ncbi:MAG TPA: hypothetical protein VGQ99_19455, partial [Tepidisphaeraceae bacterium]|nr:hypothetical protein [Tepidisphaeraceae bacterium]
GYIEGTDANDYNTKLLAVKDALARSVVDVKVIGLSDKTEVSILAARCYEGPDITYNLVEMADRGGNYRRGIDFTVTAEVMRRVGHTVNPDDDEDAGELDQLADPSLETFSEKVSTRPDQLRTVTRTGDVRGPNTVNRFLTGVLTGFTNIYAPRNWIVTHEYELNLTGLVLNYTMTAIELLNQLPGGNAEFAVEGEHQQHTERDEQMRYVTTHEWDLLCSGGGYAQVLALIRPTPGPGEALVRESITVTLLREIRLRASFQLIRGADGNQLMNWTETLRITRPDDVWEEKRYPGIDPIFVKQPKGVTRITQSGSAIGAGVWIKAPDPIFGNFLLEPPEVSYAVLNQAELQTNWNYVMGADGFEPKPGDVLGRPETPQLVG